MYEELIEKLSADIAYHQEVVRVSEHEFWQVECSKGLIPLLTEAKDALERAVQLLADCF